ncbi:nuclease-related domain-containing protein [Flavobacterium dankookense]|uniref:Nuclease-like protein n=1 Tax=Flavobacterium dankookense TaxID=706186 RepID=A0A4R6Q5W4_9FLAO|nr:nuclease-related domain-containing protein [Flavobacterium dankookense]TDP57631.1 nuclease-like protein [Flavobacterium dankookense]
MCRTYNKIGSLKSLKIHLEKNNIHDFKSIKDVITFQNSYQTLRQEQLAFHESQIEHEKNQLNIDLPVLQTAAETLKQETIQKLTEEIEILKGQLYNSSQNASTNLFHKLKIAFRNWNYKIQIKNLEQNFETNVKMAISPLLEEYNLKSHRFDYLSTRFDDAVTKSAFHSISELDRKKTIIEEKKSYIYGALGEQKVVKTLEALSDDYFLINDFDVSFYTAIYNSQEDEYIKSIQIDHILIGPPGIFLIETKNWSEKSLENVNLRSPVEQIKRNSYAFFQILNNKVKRKRNLLDRHHWGDKKIPIKNVIVFTNSKPKEEFQYVKILTVNELIGYVNYFKPIFSYEEINSIAEIIIQVNEA